MIILTHKKIGNYIYSNINSKNSFECFKGYENLFLDKNMVILGSIFPDISLKYLGKKHFFSVSYEYVLNMISEFEKDFLSMNLREFSFKLGIITHYLSDFFCYPHNNREYFKTHLKEHMEYEFKMDKIIDEYLNMIDDSIVKDNFINYELENSLEKFDGNYMNLNSYKIECESNKIRFLIDKMHKMYEEIDNNIENDIIFTLNIVCQISKMLIRKYVAVNMVNIYSVYNLKLVYGNSNPKFKYNLEYVKKLLGYKVA